MQYSGHISEQAIENNQNFVLHSSNTTVCAVKLVAGMHCDA